MKVNFGVEMVWNRRFDGKNSENPRFFGAECIVYPKDIWSEIGFSVVRFLCDSDRPPYKIEKDETSVRLYFNPV